MDIQHMHTMYETGRLMDAVAIPSREDHGWHVDCHDLWGHTLHLTTQQGQPCNFTNLDSASEAAQKIGFNEIRIVE
jgi:hypothetical protein